MSFKLPDALVPGDRIAISAISSGVSAATQPRLALVMQNLREQGFDVVEGEYVRCQNQAASASAIARAKELEHFLLDDSIAAVFPPWGGELAATILDHLDWTALAAAKPKWLMGYSDVSTVQMPLLTRLGWCSLHAANLMELVSGQSDDLTAAGLRLMQNSARKEAFVQRSSERFTGRHPDIVATPDARFVFTDPTEWKCLNRTVSSVRVTGRLFGGCLDALCSLVGTDFAPVPEFIARCGEDGAILFLENVELQPPALVRTLFCLRRNGWFDQLNGIILGRSPVNIAYAPGELSYLDALQMSLADLKCPVLYDADIGHMPPQMAIMQGVLASVEFAQGKAVLTQQWR